MQELSRLKAVYRKRDRKNKLGFMVLGDVIDSFYHEALIFKLLSQHGLLPLHEARIVDMGSGFGSRLRTMQRLGAIPENLYGVELSMERAAISRRISPNFSVVCGDVSKTPLPARNFDIVMNSTMMSSILDDALATRIAREMKRLLRPGGIVLWYDMRYDNPFNKDVRGYGRRMIEDLFPGAKITCYSVTLIPMLTRKLDISAWLYHLLHLVPFLRSHYLCVIRFEPVATVRVTS